MTRLHLVCLVNSLSLQNPFGFSTPGEGSWRPVPQQMITCPPPLVPCQVLLTALLRGSPPLVATGGGGDESNLVKFLGAGARRAWMDTHGKFSSDRPVITQVRISKTYPTTGLLFRLVWLELDSFHWFRLGFMPHVPGRPISFFRKGHLCTQGFMARENGRVTRMGPGDGP